MIGGLRPDSPTRLCLVVAIGAGCAISASTGGAAVPPSRGTPATVTLAARQHVIAGPLPALSWPESGEAAVAVAGVGLVGASASERQVPIASLTKMMTALIVLRDHPLRPRQAGPSLLLGPRDVEDWKQDVRAGDSAVEVRTGEVISEYQALEGLLVPSGDNIADRLAIWDAGSIDRFVAKMNRTARALGLGSTRYADPSGVDPGSASNASDQALLASILVADPVVRGIVRRTRINLPVVGPLPNRNPALGVDGIVGLKGGYSSHAHHCLVTAAFRGHHTVLVISVALGQPDNLAPARVDEALLQSLSRQLERRRLLAPDAVVATVSGAHGAPDVELVSAGRVPAAVVWPGLVLSEAVALRPHTTSQALESARHGTVVGQLTISAPWGVLASVGVTVSAAPAPRARRGTRARPGAGSVTHVPRRATDTSAATVSS